MGDGRLEPSGDPGHGPSGTAPWTPPELPDDLRRMGLTRNTEEGAWIEFAAMLDGRRRSHVVVAWAILLVLVGIPAFVTVRNLLSL